MNEAANNLYYTVNQVAARYGFSSYTVRKWVREGKIHAVKFGWDSDRRRCIRIPLAEIERIDREGLQ